jgi:hypothetical protein
MITYWIQFFILELVNQLSYNILILDILFNMGFQQPINELIIENSNIVFQLLQQMNPIIMQDIRFVDSQLLMNQYIDYIFINNKDLIMKCFHNVLFEMKQDKILVNNLLFNNNFLVKDFANDMTTRLFIHFKNNLELFNILENNDLMVKILVNRIRIHFVQNAGYYIEYVIDFQ